MAVARYQCEHCMEERPDEPVKVWKRRGDYNRHLKTHRNDKPYKCDECDRAFVQHSALKTHMNTHTGNKPHKCGIKGCDKRFGDPSSCSRHRKEAHSEISTYRCPHPGCPTKIKRKGTFVRHLHDNHGWRARPTEQQLRTMAVHRPPSELESDLSELESFYTPSGSASSLSPSPTPGPIIDEVYTMSPAPMSYELPYDFIRHSAPSAGFQESYTSSSVDSLSGLPAMFGAMPYSFDVSYDDDLLLNGSSSSSSSNSSTGMVSWDVDLTSFSADRGYASLPPLYGC